jgi:hypothetical protein
VLTLSATTNTFAAFHLSVATAQVSTLTDALLANTDNEFMYAGRHLGI